MTAHNPADCVHVNIGCRPTLIHTSHVYLASQHARGFGPPEARNVHLETLVGSPIWNARKLSVLLLRPVFGAWSVGWISAPDGARPGQVSQLLC